MKLPAPDPSDREKLEKLLAELDITNEEARKAAGVTVQTVYRWLNGTSPIPKSVIRMLQLMLVIKGTQRMIAVGWCEIPDDLPKEESDELVKG